jgi:hypothetical protein
MRVFKVDILRNASPMEAIYHPIGWETYDGVAITGYLVTQHGKIDKNDIMPRFVVFGWTGIMHKGVYIPPGMGG